MARLRTTGIVFAILSTLFIAFPPWIHWFSEGTRDYTTKRVRDAGYAPLWSPPSVPPKFEGTVDVRSWNTSLNIERLLAQLAGGLCVSFLIGFVIVPFCKDSTPAARWRVILWTGWILLVLFVGYVGTVVIYPMLGGGNSAGTKGIPWQR